MSWWKVKVEIVKVQLELQTRSLLEKLSLEEIEDHLFICFIIIILEFEL